MEDPDTPILRTTPRGDTVIPFPFERESILDLYEIDWRLGKKPEWIPSGKNVEFNVKGKDILSRKLVLKRIRKHVIKAKEGFYRSFAQARKKTEVELFKLFDFLDVEDLPAKMDLVDKFNQKILCGEIATVEQMQIFYKKAEQLADCIQAHLNKNEYCENFMRDVSYDVFEKGFKTVRDEEELKEKYPRYFQNESNS